MIKVKKSIVTLGALLFMSGNIFAFNSNCVQQASAAAFAVANHFGEHPNDDLGFYLEIYDAVYLDCYMQQ